MQRLLVPTLALTLANSWAADPPTPSALAAMIAEHHGLKAWQEQDVVASHVVVDFGGTRIIDHDFTFRTNGAEARMDAADGSSVIYDGEEAWLSPASAEDAKGRFHVLTWPWFIRAPFTVQEPWQELGAVSSIVYEDEAHWLSRQTFPAGVGDTPDDWYGLIVEPDSGRLAAMRYIVTYGKEPAEAAEHVSLIDYHDDQTVEGCVIATRWTFWHLDPQTGAKTGDGPKGTGTVSDIRFISVPDDWFGKPDDAERLPLPRP